MFDLKNEVPSLKLCKRLRDCGYPQDGGGWYWNLEDNQLVFVWAEQVTDSLVKAPTVAELGKILMEYSVMQEKDSPRKVVMSYEMGKDDADGEDVVLISYKLLFNDYDAGVAPITFAASSEADARAMAVIWLLVERAVKSLKRHLAKAYKELAETEGLK